MVGGAQARRDSDRYLGWWDQGEAMIIMHRNLTKIIISRRGDLNLKAYQCLGLSNTPIMAVARLLIMAHMTRRQCDIC